MNIRLLSGKYLLDFEFISEMMVYLFSYFKLFSNYSTLILSLDIQLKSKLFLERIENDFNMSNFALYNVETPIFCYRYLLLP